MALNNNTAIRHDILNFSVRELGALGKAENEHGYYCTVEH